MVDVKCQVEARRPRWREQEHTPKRQETMRSRSSAATPM
jgi:hypothetical protein